MKSVKVDLLIILLILINAPASRGLISPPSASLQTRFYDPFYKPGAVVNVGEPLVSVAQEQSSLVFRGSVKSRDSGFLRVGLPAKIKLDAFPWREFGTVVGKIIWIAPSSRITSDQEEVFDVEIQVNPEFKAHLTYGQTGTAEIVTRVRSVIDFF